MISGIIKLEVSVISLAEGQSVITLTKTLIIEDITKTESNNCFIIIHCFEENNNNVAKNLKSYCYWKLMHCACNLQISQLSAGR